MKFKSGKKKIIIALLVIMHVSFLFLIPKCRDKLFKFYLSNKITAFNNKYNAKFSIGTSEISGISNILFKDVVISRGVGVSVNIPYLNAKIDPYKLFTGKIELSSLQLNDFNVDIERAQSHSDRKKKMHTNEEKNSHAENIKEYEQNVHFGSYAAILSKIVLKIPSNLKVKNFGARINLDSHELTLSVDEIVTDNNQFSSILKVDESGDLSYIHLSGEIDNGEVYLKIAKNNEKNKIPLIKWLYNTEIEFDMAEFKMAINNGDGEKCRGIISFDNLTLKNDRISQDRVNLSHLHLDYSTILNNDFFELSRGSQLFINKLVLHPYIKIHFLPEGRVQFSLSATKFPSENLFTSLPEGLFHLLGGMRTRGELSYNLRFLYTPSHPDTLTIESKLQKHNFGIVHFGTLPLTYINEPFTYVTHTQDGAIKSTNVGLQNLNFRTLSEIPSHLKEAVLASEDPQFYHHDGFMKDAIRESIITNLKKKRFARGGSTITMQLVKNIFLNKHKTISRKLEEILITWLIESNNLVSKDRIFEIYLNIIEWGPNINGICEASRFYFNKDPMDLTLAESIFLARIIPKPSKFTFFFDESGLLKESMKKYYSSISKRLLSQGVITQFDFDRLSPTVKISGRAKNFIKITRPAQVEEYEELSGLFEDIDF